MPIGRYSVRDLWTHEELKPFDAAFSAEVQSHEARVLQLRPIHAPKK